jgi:hypothetical protein
MSPSLLASSLSRGGREEQCVVFHDRSPPAHLCVDEAGARRLVPYSSAYKEYAFPRFHRMS